MDRICELICSPFHISASFIVLHKKEFFRVGETLRKKDLELNVAKNFTGRDIFGLDSYKQEDYDTLKEILNKKSVPYLEIYPDIKVVLYPKGKKEIGFYHDIDKGIVLDYDYETFSVPEKQLNEFEKLNKFLDTLGI